MFGLFGKPDPTPSNDTQEILVCPPQEMPISCAWCNEEQGKPQGNGSHGICIPHAQQEYEKYRASRVVRQ